MITKSIVLPNKDATEFVVPSVINVPTAPVLLSVTPADKFNTIAFEAVLGVSSYNLYWSTVSPVTKTSNRVVGISNNYQHAGNNDTEYFYRVVSVNDGGESVLSNELSGTPTDFLNTKSSTFDRVNEYVNCGLDSSLQFGTASSFSLSVWVKIDSAVNANRSIFCKKDPADSDRGFELFIDNAEHFSFSLRVSTNNRILGDADADIVVIDEWCHIVFTYNGNSLISGCKLYMNGVELVITTIKDTLTLDFAAIVPFLIGGNNALTQFFEGNLDECSVWNATLTLADAQEIYNSGLPVDLNDHTKIANLVSWWRMGDGDVSPIILDQIGVNDGTMINMDDTNFVSDVPQ